MDKKNESQIAGEFGEDAPGTITLPETTIQPYPTIKKGSRGATVAKWQRMLGITADGNFGSGTDTATKAFQTQHGLTPDGVVGVATWAEALKTTSPAGMLALEFNQSSPEIPSAPAPASVIPPIPGATTVAPAIQKVVAATPAPKLSEASMMPFDSLPTAAKIGLGAIVVAAIASAAIADKKHHKK